MPLVDYSKIIGRAAWVRSRAGLEGKDPPYSTRTIIETVFPDVAVTGADLPRHIAEMATSDKHGRALFYNRSHAAPMQRVGLAHGLYHHISDIREEPGLRECDLSARKLSEIVKDFASELERSCDLFAGELLVPLHVLDRFAPDPLWGEGALPKAALEDEYDHLASRFNVPRWFAKWRLWDLHALRRSNFYHR